MGSNLHDFVSGVAGGMAGILVGQPFDVARIRLQTSVRLVDGKPVPMYSGVWTCMRTIMREEGWSSFFRGMMPPLIGVGALNAILFGTFGMTRRLVQADESQPLTVPQVAVCGSVAGFFTCIVSAPSELIKVREQMFLSKEEVAAGGTSTVKVVRSIVKVQGIPGLFKGFWMTVWRDVPSFGVYFATYEVCCKWLLGEHTETGSSTPMTPKRFAALTFAGGLAGALAWLAIYPLDVAKTYYQTQPLSHPPTYTSILDTMRKLYARYGAEVFTRGLGATLLRAFPVNGATFAVYEWCMHHLNWDE
eukprot:m.74587 g.74587  ORF g.74587 m.74587 type:complete len:304 (+) comp14518_c0_seq1:95-1006(+)